MRALLAVLLLLLPGALALDPARGPPQRLVVGFDHGVGPEDAHALRALGATVLVAPPGADFAVVAAGEGFRAKALRAAGVRYVAADAPLWLEGEPNDLHWNDLAVWPGQWGPQAIDAAGAWDVTVGSHDVVVAIVDDGVDGFHPELADNMWSNPGEVPENGVDDDGNGYVDDVRGWDCADGDNDPRGNTQQYHGTHVAGIAAARAGNVLGIAGMAQVRIMALKVFGTGTSLASAAAECLRYAADNGARVIGMSWGSGYLAALDASATYAWARGALLVKSAGNFNGGPVSYPGNLTEVIAVSALDTPTTLAAFSSTGAKVELAAPGARILSTLPLGNAFVDVPPPPPLFAYLDGTSMAQPHVAGVAALVLSKNPALTNQQVRDILAGTADDLGAPGRDPQFGHGRVNAHAAVLAAGP